MIPSWYPNAASPLAGVFVKEQVDALAQSPESVDVIVSTWGHDEFLLSPKHPISAARKFVRFMREPTREVFHVDGVQQVMYRCLTWPARFPALGLRRLLAVNRANLQRTMEERGPIDVIHAHVSFPAGFVASKLSSEFDIPYVLTEHMGPFPLPEFTRAGNAIPEIEAAFEGCSKAIAVSCAAAEQIASRGYRHPVVVPNLVDERRFRPAAHPHGRKFGFLTIARLRPQKGLDVLLRAIAHWNPDPGEFEFVIAGDGPKRHAYEKLAASLGVDDRVTWTGAVAREDVPDLFRECNVFVLPSLHESFGVVLIEAAASGKPVVATRCGGPESIVNKTTGMLVDKGDHVALAEAMREMARTWHEYDPAAIRLDFVQRFSRAPVVAQLMDVYREVLRSHKAQQDT